MADAVAQRQSQVAYYVQEQEPFKKLLGQCAEEEIFKEVSQGEAVTWCSLLVVQPRPRFHAVDKVKIKPHMIRATVVIKLPRQFMEKNRIAKGLIV